MQCCISVPSAGDIRLLPRNTCPTVVRKEGRKEGEKQKGGKERQERRRRMKRLIILRAK
jgi:hypothetical protein